MMSSKEALFCSPKALILTKPHLQIAFAVTFDAWKPVSVSIDFKRKLKKVYKNKTTSTTVGGKEVDLFRHIVKHRCISRRCSASSV